MADRNTYTDLSDTLSGGVAHDAIYTRNCWAYGIAHIWHREKADQEAAGSGPGTNIMP